MRIFCTRNHNFEDRVLAQLHKLQETIMANEQDVEGQLTGIDAALAKLITDFNAAIQALKDQIGAGTPVTQEQLDGISSHLNSILTAVQTEDTTLTPPAV